MKYVNLEYHPMDSRIRITDEDICQTLNTRMGTGGGNVPIILEVSDGAYCPGIESESCNDNADRDMPNS